MRVPKRTFHEVGHHHLAPGVYIEVLWDVVQVKKYGRRSGEKTVTPVWWRAEVVYIECADNKWRAELRYEARDGFKEQLGKVWVFPRHVRPVDDGSTQLRWRYYECSGNVAYDTGHEVDVDGFDDGEATHYETSSLETTALKQEVLHLTQRHEDLERMIVAQSRVFAQVIGNGPVRDEKCIKLFTILRQKLALMMQRPIPTTKSRRADDDNSTFFDASCAGCLNIDVDCDLQTFQEITRLVRSILPTTCFRPSFTDIHHPPPDMDQADILFQSLGDLARVIGLKSTSDVMCMALRERGKLNGKERIPSDVAMRVLGTCIMDSDDDKSPMAILACHSINKQCLKEEVNAFIRKSREFDFAARSYAHRLEPKRITGEALIRLVFDSKLSNITECQREGIIKEISSELRSFSLRWNRMASPNTRLWSRHLSVSHNINGSLEIEVPFVTFRGAEVIHELSELNVRKLLREEIINQVRLCGESSEDVNLNVG